jgi:hypothetical protein
VRLEGAPDLDPGRILRLSLLAWGAGHLRTGDARGWLLFGLEVACLVVLLVSLALLPTDRWLITYALLSGFILVWIGQAIAAYRRARRLTGRTSGAGWLLGVAPVVIALLTGFWLVAGAESSPASTFERYVGAWREGDSGAAARLFAEPPDIFQLETAWEAQDRSVVGRIGRLAEADPGWELDREHPERNLRFDYHPGDLLAGVDHVRFDVQVVRRVQVPTSFFGVVPATRSETRVVDTVGQVDVVRLPLTGPLAFTGASVWLIERVVFDSEPG